MGKLVPLVPFEFQVRIDEFLSQSLHQNRTGLELMQRVLQSFRKPEQNLVLPHPNFLLALQFPAVILKAADGVRIRHPPPGRPGQADRRAAATEGAESWYATIIFTAECLLPS